MHTLQLIKSTLTLFALLVASSALASIYSSYSPLIHPKPLLIIASVTVILGALSFFQKYSFINRQS
jgi:hypothetical protein